MWGCISKIVILVNIRFKILLNAFGKNFINTRLSLINAKLSLKIHKTDFENPQKDKPIVGMKSYFSSLGMKSREEKLLFLPWDEKWGGKVNYGDYKGSKFAQNGIKIFFDLFRSFYILSFDCHVITLIWWGKPTTAASATHLCSVNVSSTW